LGVPDEYNFVTVDLYEAKNINQVVQNIMALKRSQGYGFEKQKDAPSAAPLVRGTADQTTQEKKQADFISRQETNLGIEHDVKRYEWNTIQYCLVVGGKN
jgi:hypothetical protein